MSDKLIVEVDLVKGDTSGALGKGITQDAKKGGKVAGTAFGRSFSGAASSQLKSTLGLAALLGTLIKSTRAAVDFQIAFTEINTLLPKTAKLTKQNADALRGMADEFGTSATTQAKSFYQIVSAGITDTTKATKLLTAANKLAIGGVSDVQSSINVLTDLINVYGAENVTAKEAADSLFTTVRLGKTTMTDLATSIGAVIPIAKNSGISIDVMNAALATLTVQGLSTSENVTQLRSLFNAVAKKSKTLGAGFDLAALKAKGLSKFLFDLNKKAGGSSSALFELLGRSEAVQAVLRLTGDQFGRLNKNIDQFTTKAGAANMAFDEIAGTDAKQVEISLARMSNSFEKMGSRILPVVAAALGVVANTLGLIATGQERTAEGLAAQVRFSDDIISSIRSQIEASDKLSLIMADNRKNAENKLILEKRLTAEIEKRNKLIASGQGEAFGPFQKGKEGDGGNGEDEKALSSKAAFGAIGLDQTQILEAQLFSQQVILDTAFEQRLISQEEFQMRSDFITQQASEKAEQLRLKDESSQLATWSNLTAGFQANAAAQSASAKQVAGILTSGAGKAASAMGKALASGENVNQALVDAAKNTAAEAASAFGDYYIELGAARLAASYGADGGGALAGGLALKAVSGALGGGGGGSASGGGGSSDIGNVNPRALDPIEERERLDQQQQFVVNVQGDIFDSDATGTRLAEIFSEAGAKQGILVTDTQFS